MLNEGKSSVLKGVKATFSEKDVNIEERIKELKSQLVNEKDLEDNIEKLKKEIRESIDSKHKERKGSLNIALKSRKIPPEEAIKRYNNDIGEAKKIEEDEEILKNQQGDDRIEKEILHLETLLIPNFNIVDFSEDEVEKLIEILAKKHTNNSIPSNEIVRWLNMGLKFHDHEIKCKFCENEINYHEIEERVKIYNEDVKQKNASFIMNKIVLLDQWLLQVSGENFNNTKIALANYLEDSDTSEIYKTIELSIKVIKDFSKRLKDKISDMDQSDEKSCESFISAVKSINDSKNLLDKLRSEKLNKLRNQNENLATLVKGAIGLAIRDDNNIQMKLKELESSRTNLKETEVSNKSIENQITDLKNKGSDHEDFREFLNTVLEDLQIDMKLIPHKEGKNYSITHNKFDNTPLSMKDISEGERNLLALLFFYYQLYDDNEQKRLKDTIKLIIFDDPISSLDDANKFYVIEMLKNIFKNDNRTKQVFIFTHVWDDFCNLSYGLKTGKNNPYAFFELYKNSNSYSEIRSAKSYISPYRKLFKEISEFTKKDMETFDDCDIHHTPNSMRRVFEEFLQFKSSSTIIPTKAQQNKVEAVIIKSTDGRKINGSDCSGGNYLTKRKKMNLGRLLEVINILSHNTYHSINEVHQCATFMMNLLKDMDPTHYHAMLHGE